MPKTLLQIKDFNLGIINAVDESDIPEGGLANVTNLMCDVPGKIRPMGSDKVHDDLENNIAATITPGYGLFAYRSDFRVSDDLAIESKILAFQNLNGIGFYDVESTDKLLLLGDMNNSAHPTFYYSSVDGALRVCDSNFQNTAPLADTANSTLDTNSHTFVKYLKFINKTWFPSSVTYEAGTGNESGFSTHNFSNDGMQHGLDAFIYPPTVANSITALDGATTAATSYNLCHQASAGDDDVNTGVTVAHLDADSWGGGNIAIHVDHTDDTDGTWQADTDMKFGASFVYEGDQESTVTPFAHDGANTGADITHDFYSLDVTLYVSTTGWDPRIIGVNIYYIQNSLGEFNDPKKLIDFYFGSSEFDPPYIQVSGGQKINADQLTITDANNVAHNTAPIKIMHEPAMTYSLTRGYSHNSSSTACIYKSVVIANRRTYLGGVRRLKFDVNTIADAAWQDGQNESYKQPTITYAKQNAELDVIAMSPPDNYDVFPDEVGYFLSIGSNDGEHIVALVEFADRLLQFKTNKLYIINLSQADEYLEAEYDYMGIQYPYQVIRTEKGIAWTNGNGCYLYNDEGITNLIHGKLHKSLKVNNPDDVEGWFDFSNNTGMIGYVPVSEQLIVFENPEASNIGAAGNAFVYSFLTESWTRALNVLSALPKSNIVTNYDNTCLYATLQQALDEEITAEITSEEGGSDAFWELNDVNSPGLTTDADGSVLRIGDTDITNVMHFPDSSDGTISFLNYLTEKIEFKHPNTFIFSEPFPGTLRITRSSHSMDGTFVGALNWDTDDNYGPPVTAAQQFISHVVPVKMRNEIGNYEGPIYNYAHTINWVNSSPINIGGVEYWLNARYFQWFGFLGLINPAGLNYVSDTVRDSPRIIITATDVSVFWDCDNDTVMTFDMFSSGGHGSGQLALVTADNDNHMLMMRYVNQPRVDGTGPYNAAGDQHDGSLICTRDTDTPATIQIPSAIFGSFGAPIGDDGVVRGWYIFVPGDYSSSFTEGNSITISGVESNANSSKSNALNISMVLSNINYDPGEDPNDLGHTALQFHIYDQPSASVTNDWPYLIPWTTFSTVTIAQSNVATIGSTNAGSSTSASFYSITPKRHDAYSHDSAINSIYGLGIDGQNGSSYSIYSEGTHDINAFEISSDFKTKLEGIRDEADSNPFGVPSMVDIQRAYTLYEQDNFTQVKLAANITSAGTTTFDVTDAININVGQFLQFGGNVVTATPGYSEIVKVTGITTNRLTVARAQMGTPALSIVTVDAHPAFALNIVYQSTDVSLTIYGGDYRDIFTSNTLFRINTRSDIYDNNPWPEGDVDNPIPWSVVSTSSYSSTNFYTVIYTDTSEIYDPADVGSIALPGTNGSYYLSSFDDRPLIQTSVLKVPGRLTTNTGLPILRISGIVTRSLEIREFLNTETWSNSHYKNIIVETKSYDFGDSGQEVKIYKIAVNARHIRGHVEIYASLDGNPYLRMNDDLGNTRISFDRSFTNKEIYFSDPSIEKKPVLARRLKIKIKGEVEGFHLNDISVIYRTKGVIG